MYGDGELCVVPAGDLDGEVAGLLHGDEVEVVQPDLDRREVDAVRAQAQVVAVSYAAQERGTCKECVQELLHCEKMELQHYVL